MKPKTFVPTTPLLHLLTAFLLGACGSEAPTTEMNGAFIGQGDGTQGPSSMGGNSGTEANAQAGGVSNTPALTSPTPVPVNVPAEDGAPAPAGTQPAEVSGTAGGEQQSPASGTPNPAQTPPPPTTGELPPDPNTMESMGQGSTSTPVPQTETPAQTPASTTPEEDPTTPEQPSTQTPAVTPGTPSNGCSVMTAETGSALDKTLSVGGTERTYRLSVPADYLPGEPLPLIFGLNGVGGDGKGAQASFKLETNHRGIFVYPDSLYKESSGTVDWEYGGNGYDVDFFDALMAELTASYCVDMDRVFALGVSAGGIMSNMLGCFRGDVLRAIAPASAMTWNNNCKGSVAVMVFCGEKDTFNPCDTDAKGETDFWTAENSCGAQTAASPIADICNSFEGCTEDPVLLCQHSGGHMWPTGGSDMVWSFFMGL